MGTDTDNPGGSASLRARLSLGEALLEERSFAEALAQYTAVLASDPSNVSALQGAARAAEGAGEQARAKGYRALLQALGDGSDESVADDASPPVESGSGSWTTPRKERLRVLHKDQPTDLDWMAETSAITLADVAGMESVKRRLNVAFLGPLRNPDLRKAYGKSLRGGLLLYGPPGCGKTYIARATAGELGAKFISIGLSDVLDMWIGESERHLHELFDTARRSAPCVLFFDEVDAIGQKRSLLRHSAGRNVVAQLLSELDGIDHNNDGVFVLGASNHPWDIDTALMRPGRFDRMALVLPPDREARAAILEMNLAERPVADIDLQWLAERTSGFSGADLAHLCESAAELAMEDSMDTGTVRAITAEDFAAALKEVRPSTRRWFETARNFVMFANEGGMYDDLMTYMRANDLL